MTFLSVGGAGATTQDFLLDLLDTTSYLASLAHPPSVLSSSYGWNEEDISAADARKACAGLMALAARGVSILTSSGDGGVRGSHDQASQCGNNTFVPTFPSTCPYGKPGIAA
jgi:tripeptidyl-peptidase-1